MATDRRAPVSRRRFGVLSCGALASFAFGGADVHAAAWNQPGSGPARLLARPRRGVTTTARGTQPLGLDARDALLQIPAAAAAPLPLLVLLHGAGGSGAGILRRLGPQAEAAGVAVLAPDARSATWDAIRGGFGPDVRFLDGALGRAFARVAVDPARVSVGGFSDGATYALSLGLANGDLFSRILAFSPGFVAGGTVAGKPRVLVTHGTADPVLPIDRCSRVIVAALRKRGYDVTFREFVGGHDVPADLAREGMAWVAGGTGAR